VGWPGRARSKSSDTTCASEVPSLHRHYPASAVLRTSPPPRSPGLSLAGIRLVTAGHTLGLPVLRTLSLCTCCRHYPGAAAGRTLRSASPSRISLPRKGCLTEGFSHFVSSMTAPVASGWSGCRVGFAPTGTRRLFTAHTQTGRSLKDRLPKSGTSKLTTQQSTELHLSSAGEMRGRLRSIGCKGRVRMRLGDAGRAVSAAVGTSTRGREMDVSLRFRRCY
jgi:hypothetical protein